MVPTRHVRLWNRLNGSLPIGGRPTEPSYMDDEVKVTTPLTSGIAAVRKRGIPSFWDRGDVFKTRLHDPVDDATTVLWHQSAYLQVWTGALSAFGVDAVVLEPLSAMSDAFNNHDGLHMLSAGQSFRDAFGIRIE
uniref:Uncharacterized protein n=1 Tax=Haptolina ericina TaxID=156174 RepID=A0A7S3EQS1_9EUKA|mmetsp:Transcript_10738/g.24701  ORF Transcript_10738/g.24701 Transcript_10738/m.24701 type:complete len:135 (+) Transcript_10738:684-1088(+)